MPIPAFREDGWLPAGHHQASWDEVISRFGGDRDSRRSTLTAQLIELRDGFRRLGVVGCLLLDGSYVSAKPIPGDFDVLLVGPCNIQAMKEMSPELSQLLDAERAEKELGYSLFYIPSNSPALELLSTLWNLTKDGIEKGVIEVQL